MPNYKPVILLGNGIRGNPTLINYLCSLNIPILTTWMAADLIPEDHSVFCGRPGIFGQRAANIIQQKATHLYCFGARLDGEQVAYDYDRFAPSANKFVYEIDRAELEKFPQQYIPMHDSLTMKQWDIWEFDWRGNPAWLKWCKNLYDYFRPELDGNPTEKFIDPFYFVTLLHEFSRIDDVFAIGSSGNAPTTFYQSYKIKKGQRVTNVCTVGAMGADIPMAIGAALASGKRTICITGDGGFQMNVQELEVVRRLKLPIIFFVMNNNGYNSIRVAQKARFGRVTGADPQSGATFAKIEDIAGAYHMMYFPLRHIEDFHRCFDATPMIVEVFIDPEWQQFPRVMASTVNGELRTDNMEDMTPKLNPDELQRIMNESPD